MHRQSLTPPHRKFLHDPATYADPLVFKPERFLGAAERDPREMCFGFGRRVCPGQNLAELAVWLSCAMSLAAFNIGKARDVRGEEITPVPDMSSGTISHPRPFHCDIRARSKREELIKAVDFVGN